MEGDCNVYALFAVDAQIIKKMIYFALIRFVFIYILYLLEVFISQYNMFI